MIAETDSESSQGSVRLQLLTRHARREHELTEPLAGVPDAVLGEIVRLADRTVRRQPARLRRPQAIGVEWASGVLGAVGVERVVTVIVLAGIPSPPSGGARPSGFCVVRYAMARRVTRLLGVVDAAAVVTTGVTAVIAREVADGVVALEAARSVLATRVARFVAIPSASPSSVGPSLGSGVRLPSASSYQDPSGPTWAPLPSG